MIEVLLYGNLRELVEHSNPDASAIMFCEYVEGEHLQDLLDRLGLNPEDVGNCYINNTPASPNSALHDRDTIELNQPD
ncbi:MAG: MoaD/ThiS family protein [Candidatus Hermodarchaeota archaeon]